MPAPTVTEPESQQDDDPVLPAPVPIPKPFPLSIPLQGISLITSGNEASALLALKAALALQEAKLTQLLAALAAQEARAVACVIPTANTTVKAAVDLSAITAQALIELLKRSTPKSPNDDGGSSSSDDSSDDDSYDPADHNSCSNTRVPGGPIGVRLKSNALLSCAYAESFGLMRDPCNKFRVVRASGKRQSHSRNGNSGSVLQRMAIKWFLKARIARSAALRRCIPAGVS